MAYNRKELKLLVRGTSHATRARLYAAPDHLLLIEGTYVEEVRRFFVDDIEALLWHTDRKAAVGIGILAVLFTLIGGLITSNGDPAFIFLGLIFLVPGLIAAARLIYVLSTGGYKKVFVQTAAQQTILPGVSTSARLNKVLKVLDERVTSGQAVSSMPDGST